MSLYVEDGSLEEKIVQINEALKEVKDIQKYLVIMENRNNKILMKKIDKLQEFNEISDMTNQVFETRISNIETSLEQLISKLSA